MTLSRQKFFLSAVFLLVVFIALHAISGKYPELPPARIVMTAEGFSPDNLVLQKGQKVLWINQDIRERWPASDPHPTHGILPSFDPLEPIPPEGSWSFAFTKEGEWKFHDHLIPRFRGVIRVQ